MDNKLKIMMIAEVPRNLSEIKGGPEAATVNLVSSLRQMNVDLHVVTIRKDLKVREVVPLGDNCMIYYFPYTWKNSKLIEFLYFGQHKVAKLFRRLNPDVVHIQGTGPILLLLRGIDRRKIVITQHGIMAEEFKYKVNILRKIKFILKMMFDALFIPLFNNYISISRYNRMILTKRQKGNVGFFTRVIHNPVNPAFFQTNAVMGKPRIIFVGLVNKLKGVHLLVEALYLLKQEGLIYSLDIVGGSKEPEYLQSILNMVERLGLSTQVVMHGWVNQQRVKELIQENSIFLLPSLQECLPISIAEAMAAGRVVVATRTGGVPEMFTDKVSGFLFPKNDVEALVAILRNLYIHPETMIKVGANARQEAVRKFESGAVATQTLRFYDHLCQHNILHKLLAHVVA